MRTIERTTDPKIGKYYILKHKESYLGYKCTDHNKDSVVWEFDIDGHKNLVNIQFIGDEFISRDSGFYKVEQKNDILTFLRYEKGKGWWMQGGYEKNDEYFKSIDERRIPLNVMDLIPHRKQILEPCYCGTKKVVGYKEKSELPINLTEKELRKMAKKVCKHHKHAMRYQNMLNACFKMGNLVIQRLKPTPST